MEQVLNITEENSPLIKLAREVKRKNSRIVISTEDEPQAILMPYNTFLFQQELPIENAEYHLQNLIVQAQDLLEAAQEGCLPLGDPKLYMFWGDFGQVMHKAWKIAKDLSRPHAAVAFQLFELSERCTTGDMMLEAKRLQPVGEVLKRLKQSDFTMEDAAAMDWYLLQNDIDARYPTYIDADLNALDERDVELYVGE